MFQRLNQPEIDFALYNVIQFYFYRFITAFYRMWKLHAITICSLLDFFKKDFGSETFT